MHDAWAPPAEAPIFAVATGQGGTALAVIRVSGPDTARVIERLVGPVPPPRRASLRHVRAADGEVLDEGLVIWFPGPRSYTGEDTAELQLHGGPAVIGAVSAALAQAGARPAEPGEFTRRSFVNGRMDLLRAEGVADLISAETQSQRRMALFQLQGGMSRLHDEWSGRLTVLLAEVEARLDFPDETEPETSGDATGSLAVLARALAAEMRHAAGTAAQAERLREGITVALTGAPNVGKSSLVNALASRDVSIVSARPGTTRDVVAARIVLADVPVTLLDMAGLRETDDEIEQEGVRRARASAERADIVVVIRAADVPDAQAQDADTSTCPTIRVWNKTDLSPAPAGWSGVSARSGAGLSALREQLAASVRALLPSMSSVAATHERHRVALSEAATALETAAARDEAELQAEELRLARRALDRITGRVDVDEVLDVVFRHFCIGK